MGEYIEDRIKSLSARVKCLEDSLQTITDMLAKTSRAKTDESQTDQTTDEFVRVKRGHWIQLYKGNYKCSSCGAWWSDTDNEVINDFIYCPSCGAEMSEEVDTTDYLDCHYCKHKGQDNYVCAHCLSCMRAYGIYTKEDNEDMEGEYGWPKLDYFERI